MTLDCMTAAEVSAWQERLHYRWMRIGSRWRWMRHPGRDDYCKPIIESKGPES